VSYEHKDIVTEEQEVCQDERKLKQRDFEVDPSQDLLNYNKVLDDPLFNSEAYMNGQYKTESPIENYSTLGPQKRTLPETSKPQPRFLISYK